MNFQSLIRSWDRGLSLFLRGDSAALRYPFSTLHSGALSLDSALAGGIPSGRLTELFGPPSTGKTTLALRAIAALQARGGVAVYLDAEHSLDPVYARAQGVDLDAFLLGQPQTTLEALELSKALLNSLRIDLVVLDNLSALADAPSATRCAMALRALAGAAAVSDACVLFLTSELLPGQVGHQLRFYAQVRIALQLKEALKREGKSGGKMVGHRVRAQVLKNKTRETEARGGFGEFRLLY